MTESEIPKVVRAKRNRELQQYMIFYSSTNTKRWEVSTSYRKGEVHTLALTTAQYKCSKDQIFSFGTSSLS